MELTDAYGAPVEPGDHVAPIGDPTHAVLVTAVTDTGTLLVRHDGDAYRLRPRLVRVVTIRDNAGARLGAGDIVRHAGDPDGPTFVIASVEHTAHLVVLSGQWPGDAPRPAVPALLVRVGSAVMEGDTVIDADARIGVVMVPGPDHVLVDPVDGPVDGGGRYQVARAELRRVDDSTLPTVQVAEDGSFRVTALDGMGDLADDVDALLRGEQVATVIPFPRAKAG